MGKEGEIESVVAAEPEESQPLSTPTEVQEKEKRACCRPGVCALTAGALAPSHVFLLRIVGWITIFFAVTEFGLGGAVFNYFDNVKLGAWWVGFLAFFAGLCGALSINKDCVLAGLIISLASCVVAVVGAALDGVSSHTFRGITTCASRHDGASAIIYYGLPRDNPLAKNCLYSAATIEVDGCYCVSKNQRTCNEYTLSNYATYYNQGCDDIITNYSDIMATSTAFCVFCFLMTLILAVLSALVLFRPELLTSTRQPSSKDHIPAETSVIEEAPANAAAVPNAEVEAKVGVAIIA